MLGTERESGIGETGGIAAYGVVGCVFEWAGMGTPCESPLECVVNAGDFKGKRRLSSACGGSGASEGGTLALGASYSVEGWWVELEWSDAGRGDGVRWNTVYVFLSCSFVLCVSSGGEGAGRAS